MEHYRSTLFTSSILFSFGEDLTDPEAAITALSCGVSMLTLSAKLPTKVIMFILWVSLSILLKNSIKRSSSANWSRGRRSRSYWRSTLTSASVGRKRIRHSTKSTGKALRSNLNKTPTVSISCSVLYLSKNCFNLAVSAYFSIALQISSVVLLAFRNVMAKFLDRLWSRSVTLFTTFWDTLLFVEARSTTGPWALVLNSSSNLSSSSSCRYRTVKIRLLYHLNNINQIWWEQSNTSVKNKRLFVIFTFIFCSSSSSVLL